ncbi:MAG: hotdog domain-containing protein [Pseudomonadota bacterium]
MTDTLRQDAAFPGGPAAAASLLEPLLAGAAGVGAEPVSLTLDYGRVPSAGDPVTAEAWIDRATRTLVFAHGRLTTANGDLVASGSAVFRRQAAAPVAA